MASGEHRILSSDSKVVEYLLSVAEGKEVCVHTMYEPGRTYPDIQLNRFDDYILRLGDLHHLSNPLTSAYLYMQSISANRCFMNTTPQWVPLFSFLGFRASFWSDLSESGRISHSELSYDIEAKAAQPLRIGYIGHTLSKAHPRRSWIVNRLLASGASIELVQYSDHKTWFTNLKKLHYVISPTLNAQISHNLYTPGLLGCFVLTDRLSTPSGFPIDPNTLPIYEFADFDALCNFISLPTSTLKKYWLHFFQENGKETRIKLLNCDLSGGHYKENDIYQSYANINSCNSGFTFPSSLHNSHDMTISPLLLLNIIEILQEMHRLSVGTIYLGCGSADLLILLSRLLCLPRFLLSLSSDNSFDSTDYLIAETYCQGSARLTKTIFSWHLSRNADDDYISEEYLEPAILAKLPLGRFHQYRHRLHCNLAVATVQ